MTPSAPPFGKYGGALANVRPDDLAAHVVTEILKRHRDLGASGARILGGLAHELKRRGGGYGVAAICIGVGQGLAVVLEA